MFRKISFSVFVSVCLAAGIYWFLYTKEARTPVNAGINAIPNDAAIILESKQIKETWKKLSQTNIMWEELLGTRTFSRIDKQVSSIDSVIELNPAVSELLEGNSVYVSIHRSKKETNFLFVFSLPNRTYKDEAENFFEKINNGREIVYTSSGDENIGQITASKNISFHFVIAEGIVIISPDQELLKNSIQQIKTRASIASDKVFSQVLNTAGKKVDANIYINYKVFPELIQPFVFNTFRNEINYISGLAAYSGWDATIRPNSLMLTGFTSGANPSGLTYLSMFARQKPQSIKLTSVVPQRTALMVFYGLSNFQSFYQDRQKFLQSKGKLEAHQKELRQLNETYHVDAEKIFIDHISNEIALIVTEPSSVDFKENSFAIIHSSSTEDLLTGLNAAVDTSNYYSSAKSDTSTFRGYKINHLNIPSFLPKIFGDQFIRLTDNYFTSMNDYIIFGNTREALQQYITEFDNNKTLSNDKNYLSFAENLSDESNFYIYTSIARSANIYKSYLTEEYSTDIDNKMELIHKFESAGIQFSNNDELFYSNIFLKYNPVYKKETETLWESPLDTTVSSKPFLLVNHNTKAKEVFVQDDANKVYLISNTGKVIWTKQLHEKIMSDVIQVDVLKNNKLQLVFNTRSSIYMYDRNGNDMKGFPVKLSSPATNAISVIDYENNRDYRIFIACENKKILCFNSSAEIVKGFEFEKTRNPVYTPVQYFRSMNKDHLCAIDSKGSIYIFDRHGKRKVSIKDDLENAGRNYYIDPGKDYKRTYIVCTDTLGNVVRINLSGEKQKITLQEFETSPYFEYRDINNDKTKEYIFLTRDELKVFNADKSLMFNYKFPSPVAQYPQFFLFPDGKGKIGVVSEGSSEIYLFNDNGSLCPAFPLKGKTLFSIGDMNNEGAYNLITGSSDNSIYVYPLE